MHRHVLVDGKIVDRPSFRVKPGQTVQIKPKSQATVPFQVAAAGAHRDVLPAVPGYLDVQLEKLSSVLVERPQARRDPRDVRGPAGRRVLRPLIRSPHGRPAAHLRCGASVRPDG